MVVEAFGAAFAADAGIVDAAPGRGRVEPMMIVDQTMKLQPLVES
jgi:hypothetical protein